jgi:hypothetical protein
MAKKKATKKTSAATETEVVDNEVSTNTGHKHETKKERRARLKARYKYK